MPDPPESEPKPVQAVFQQQPLPEPAAAMLRQAGKMDKRQEALLLALKPFLQQGAAGKDRPGAACGAAGESCESGSEKPGQRSRSKGDAMMYNRYIPDAAGVYHPTRVGAEPQAAAPAPPPEPVCVPPAPPPPAPPCTAEHGGFLSRLLPRSIDTGDLLMLLILLLLVVDGEEEDQLSVILTAAAFCCRKVFLRK